MHKRKEKVREFNRGHFPRGTSVSIRPFPKEPAIDTVVLACTSNGYDSWIVHTMARRENGEQYVANICHVKEIFLRGPDCNMRSEYKLPTDHHQSIFWPGKHHSNYCGSVSALVSYLIDKIAANEPDHLYDVDAILREVRTRLPRNEFSQFDFIEIGKRKLQKIVKAAMQRNRTGRRKAQHEYDKEMDELFRDDNEADFQFPDWSEGGEDLSDFSKWQAGPAEQADERGDREDAV